LRLLREIFALVAGASPVLSGEKAFASEQGLSY
jgi:hypothetical protein